MNCKFYIGSVVITLIANWLFNRGKTYDRYDSPMLWGGLVLTFIPWLNLIWLGISVVRYLYGKINGIQRMVFRIFYGMKKDEYNY